MKTSILAAPDKVAQLAAAVQAAMPEFVVDVKSGDNGRSHCRRLHDDDQGVRRLPQRLSQGRMRMRRALAIMLAWFACVGQAAARRMR